MYLLCIIAACLVLRLLVSVRKVKLVGSADGFSEVVSRPHRRFFTEEAPLSSNIYPATSLHLREYAFAGALGKDCDASSLRNEPALALGGPGDIVYTNRSDAIRESLARSTSIDRTGRGFAVLIVADADYFAYVAAYALVLQSELPFAHLLVYVDGNVPGSFLKEFSEVVGIAHERVIFTRMTNREKIPPRYNKSATMGFLRFLIDDPPRLRRCPHHGCRLFFFRWSIGMP